MSGGVGGGGREADPYPDLWWTASALATLRSLRGLPLRCFTRSLAPAQAGLFPCQTVRLAPATLRIARRVLNAGFLANVTLSRLTLGFSCASGTVGNVPAFLRHT
jgi:hypothetical protein